VIITRIDSVPAKTGVMEVVDAFLIIHEVPHPVLLTTVSPMIWPEIVPSTPSAVVATSVVWTTVGPALRVIITSPAAVVSAMNEYVIR
jgi:hypothetical protein